ncbi:hydroxymethylglutaryl-CoA lyase [Chryseolinea sp. T2]|uniref:hydroxymethylglutaryl-CoA lyase n=1 Tax=Chryseolinea sp. T2 TaxID=3129255 RepID=UPI0030773813
MKIIECPRDAMQGIDEFMPTENKIRYINQLLKVGFDTIDFGSFVSPKVIPQMKDTSTVYRGLELNSTRSKLLAIVANQRGARDASLFEKIDYLGFPLSISETFQRRNTNMSIDEAVKELDVIKSICVQSSKKLVVYISMGFGNPYGDPYGVNTVSSFVKSMIDLGADVLSIADTVGVASAKEVSELFGALIPQFPHIEIGVHLHARSQDAHDKVLAAYNAGCRRIDGALKGYGGCPMANDSLVGNIPTELLIAALDSIGAPVTLDRTALQHALACASATFPAQHL